MGKIFEFNANKGSYLDQVSKTLGVNTNGEFKQTSKGIAWLGNGVDAKIVIIEKKYAITTSKIIISFWVKRNIASSRDIVLGNSTNIGYSRMVIGDENIFLETDTNGDFGTGTLLYGDTHWHCYSFVFDNGMISIYQDGKSLVMTDDTISDDLTIDQIAAEASTYFANEYIHNIKSETFNTTDEALNIVNNLYKDFLRPPVTGSSIYKNDYPIKASDYSLIPNITAGYNCVPSGSILVDVSHNDHNIDINSGIISTKNGIWLGNNTQAENIGNVKSMSFRFKPTTLNDKLFEGSAATDMIYLSSGTLTHSFGDCYVDGISGATIATAGESYTVTLTSTADIDFSAFSAGINDTTKSAYELNDLVFCDTVISEQEIKDYHDQFVKPVIISDFNYDGIGNFPKEFQEVSGAFEISETVVDGKYLECTSGGAIKILYTDTLEGTASIKYYDGSDWYEYEDTLTNLISTHAWLSHDGQYLIFTLSTNDRIGKFYIKNGVKQ